MERTVKNKTKLKKDDQVIVLAGKDRGKKGSIVEVNLEKGRAIVSGIAIVKKHQRPNQKAEKGGIIEKESSINLSNIMLYCAKCNKGVRISVEFDKKGIKSRKCAACENKI